MSIPITFFDLRLALANPEAVINALGLNAIVWLRYTAVAFIAAILAALGFGIFTVYSRASAFLRCAYTCLPEAAAVLFVIFIGQQSLMRYAAYLRDSLPLQQKALWQNLWLPTSQQFLAKKMGFFEYLAFSATEEGGSHDFKRTSSPGPTPSEIRDAATSFVNIASDSGKLLPNIVVMHAESTFDPNRAFKLSSRVQLPLWSGTTDTELLGPLHVNIVGGGSSVTDFEVITGVDTRLFGFQGYYTNYYVAPMLKYSFVKYLSEKGYDTKTFYTWPGGVFNSRNAFKYYGFAEFTDAPTLGIAHYSSDKDFVARIGNDGAFDIHSHSRPFLYYIDTNENHGPHPCKNFISPTELRVHYSDVSDFELNCQLNEYLIRAASTSDAFLDILTKLRKLKAATGRPYVLLAYGDHQPWDFFGKVSFAGWGSSSEGVYDSLKAARTDADVHETIFHVASSEAGIIRGPLAVTPPATFLPTLISAFVASSYDDLYFPQNFYLLKMCGSDFAAPTCEAYSSISATLRTDLLSKPHSGLWHQASERAAWSADHAEYLP
jgi:phosphoglycerol transferase MdoB-like AlkP superfamily enzyme